MIHVHHRQQSDLRVAKLRLLYTKLAARLEEQRSTTAKQMQMLAELSVSLRKLRNELYDLSDPRPLGD